LVNHKYEIKYKIKKVIKTLKVINIITRHDFDILTNNEQFVTVFINFC